jgi:bifunctional non-homologous end joining protein LigD
MPRFTISRHTGSKEGDHYDFLLEHGDTLRTWRLENTSFQFPQGARQIKDHRKTYLDYEGEISGGRGSVKIWDTGTYVADRWSDQHIRIAIVGRQLKTRLRLDRTDEGGHGREPVWTVMDAANVIRKNVAAFLRDFALDDAPTPELGDLREALAHEERKILAVVDQYTHGGAVEWSQAETDPQIRKKLESAKARWQHPWLASAKAYADKIEELTGLLREYDRDRSA